MGGRYGMGMGYSEVTGCRGGKRGGKIQQGQDKVVMG